MTVKLLTAAIVTLALSVNSADAQTIRGKAQNQRQRIKQGVKSGELTKAEAKNVINDQREIRQDVKEAKADGTVTKEEEKILSKTNVKLAVKFIAKSITTEIETNNQKSKNPQQQC